MYVSLVLFPTMSPIPIEYEHGHALDMCVLAMPACVALQAKWANLDEESNLSALHQSSYQDHIMQGLHGFHDSSQNMQTC